MEVVEAIENIKYKNSTEKIYTFTIIRDICKIESINEEIVWVKGDNKLEAATQAINKFLIWYKNEQTRNNNIS